MERGIEKVFLFQRANRTTNLRAFLWLKETGEKLSDRIASGGNLTELLDYCLI